MKFYFEITVIIEIFIISGKENKQHKKENMLFPCKIIFCYSVTIPEAHSLQYSVKINVRFKMLKKFNYSRRKRINNNLYISSIIKMKLISKENKYIIHLHTAN